MRLANKVALITGGTSGIGEATALLFAKEGAKVAITGRDEKRGHAVTARILESGGQAIFIRTDVRKGVGLRYVRSAYSAIAAATDRFNESTSGLIGMRTR